MTYKLRQQRELTMDKERATKNQPSYITRLKEMIDHSGLTAEAVAKEFGVTARAMQYYVAGQRRVRDYLRPQMAAFFRCSEDFLFPPYATLSTTHGSHLAQKDLLEEKDMMKRRDLLLGAGLSLILSSEIADTTQRIAHALAHPGRLDESAMQSLEAVTKHAWLLDPGFSRSASRDAVVYIERQLEEVTLLLSEAPAAFHKRLYSTCGELCMISAWLLRELGEPDQAMVRHLQALQCATRAENYALCADIKSRVALLLIHHEGPYSALPHIEDAVHYAALAGNQITPRRLGWIFAISAEVHGGVRGEKATLTALEMGEQGLQSYDTSDYYTTAYSLPVFSGFKAMALMQLGRYDDARAEFSRSLKTQQMSTYRRAHKTADLSILEISAGNIELAAQYMSQAVDLSTEVGSPILNKHLLKVRKKLLPSIHTCEAIKRLDTQMRECGIVITRNGR